ncbi:unnamed protein product [Boreogadus saida]
MAKSEIRAMEPFLKSTEMCLWSRLCLVVTYVWRKLWDILCYWRRDTASKALAMQGPRDVLHVWDPPVSEGIDSQPKGSHFESHCTMVKL